MSTDVAIQKRHFLLADARALYPPIAQLAKLSAETIVIVPRKLAFIPLTTKLTPCSYISI